MSGKTAILTPQLISMASAFESARTFRSSECFSRTHKKSRIGVKLLSSAVCVSLLTSLTILASNQNISPSEAWLVLSLVNAYGTPRSAAINHSSDKKGGIPIFFAGLSLVWQDVFFMWFFATLIRNLPLLGTNNQVWLFTAVDILGWFRILMLVYCGFCCLLLPFQVVSYIALGAKRFGVWTEGKEDNDDGTASEDTSEDTQSGNDSNRSTWSIFMEKAANRRRWL